MTPGAATSDHPAARTIGTNGGTTTMTTLAPPTPPPPAPPPAWGPPQVTPPAPPSGDRRRGSLALRLVASVAALGVVGGIFTIASLAVFTDTDQLPTNTFSTGDIDLTTDPTSASFTVSGMAPGDVEYRPITVSNLGSLQLRYSLRSQTTEDVLASQLNLRIRQVDTCTAAGWAADTTTSTDWDGVLGSSIAPGTQLFGNPAQGVQGGERVLDGAGGANDSEIMCFRVELPLSSDNTYEGLSTTANFTFESEQTKNNP